MALSKLVRDELEAEREAIASQVEALTDQVARLRGRQDALAAILDDDGFTLAGGGTASVDIQQLGMRDAIRAVLRETGSLKPAKVARILEKRGYSPGGATDLSRRVGNDLWKMHKAGALMKNSAGEYSLPGA